MRECYSCGSIKTYLNHWYRNRPLEQWLCNKCNLHLITNPKWKPITSPITNKKWSQINNSRRLWFRDRVAKLTYVIKSGHCSKCSNNIFDKSCKATHMHHWAYIIIFPWFGTEELCASCHAKQRKNTKYRLKI